MHLPKSTACCLEDSTLCISIDEGSPHNGPCAKAGLGNVGMGLCSLQKREDLRRGLEDVGEGGPLLNVGGDDGGPVVDTGGGLVVENEASVVDVGAAQSGGAKTEEFEREEGKVGLAKGNEKGMELVEVREVGALSSKAETWWLSSPAWEKRLMRLSHFESTQLAPSFLIFLESSSSSKISDTVISTGINAKETWIIYSKLKLKSVLA
ncbi:hypothetical protein AMTR_s00032p00243640 [Amborella trichopoda]|uniref:Uncharacterized protein n=1 Tax=Amborella trichopoda TaxID=13333 RepID=U5D0Z3_AMBTC|nr:hypothetical protein AMTR_s00032p00243640 [Amborella trichopoda]